MHRFWKNCRTCGILLGKEYQLKDKKTVYGIRENANRTNYISGGNI